jgi:hypothetical protein
MANQAEAERSRRARIILALAEEQAAGKLAGKLIDQSPSAIKLRLYQTLANIATEKTLPYFFHSQKRFCLEKRKQNKKQRKRKKIIREP